MKERIIIGIDPGTRRTGYGLIKTGRKNKLLACGVIRLEAYDDHALKLKKIFERVLSLIEEFTPDEMALEAPFYGKNVQSMLKLGRVQGVAMAAALSREIPVTEYAPKKVKQAVTGSGNASKEQVAGMLSKQFDQENLPDLPDDATDALAVAVCHAYNRQTGAGIKKSWNAFLKENPDRKA